MSPFSEEKWLSQEGQSWRWDTSDKQKFWRRKSKIASKINKQNCFSCRNITTENCFTKPHGIEKKEGVRCNGLYRCSYVIHAYITNTAESENILQPSTAGYLHSTIVWMYIYIKTPETKLQICITTYLHRKINYLAGSLWILLVNFCPMLGKGPESQ